MDSNYLENLYSENILEHSRNPKNKVESINSECKYCVGNGENVDCGDSGEIFLDIENGKIKDIFWSGNGCALSQAGMSLMTEKIKNDKLEIQDLKLWTPANIYELLGVQISPSRVNCALLAYKCLVDILRKIK